MLRFVVGLTLLMLGSSPTKVDRAAYRACMEKRGNTLRIER